MVPINYIAVIANVAVAMALGFVWYGPLFGKKWATLMGWSQAEMEKKMREGMGPKYVIQAVCALLMSFVLAHSIIFASAYLNVSGISAGLQSGIWSWIGFIIPATIGSVLWDGKPWSLWFINAGYFLVQLCLMGVILALWV